MGFQEKSIVLWTIITIIRAVNAQKSSTCPTSDTILPCICTNRQEDVQIWCTHSDLPRVSKGIHRVADFVKGPIDELIIENNYLPSLPGKIFGDVKVLRLMLRHNGMERLSAAWLENQEESLLEIYIVENELKSIPSESLMKLQNLQAITIQSNNLKRIPAFTNLQNIKYISIQSTSLNSINERTFESLPSLERLFIKGSPNLLTLDENAFYNLPKLKELEISKCGVNQIHMRAFALLPSLQDLTMNGNKISDASMVGRATRDLPQLINLNLNSNSIDKLNEGAFVDLPNLQRLYLSNNNINAINHGAFHRVPKLRIVDLDYNNIDRIHPESFLQQSGSGVEELSLIGNKIIYISEFRALLDALPRLKFLDLSQNQLEEIPRGALRGHPSLERLHINQNNIKFIQTDAFMAMPALRELHLSNNSLSDLNEGPFWNLPALKGLDLSNNFFQRLQPKLLYNLPSLRRIDLSSNELAMIDPITFLESPLLEYINISSNALVAIHPATFRNLANLYEFDASANKLVEFVPGLPRGLEHLYLQKNQITNLPVPPSPDSDLPALRTLDISSNGIQKIIQGSMKPFHNLRRFYMRRNGLRQIEISTFIDLERLEILDISDNQIINVHPKSFAKLANIKQIYLHGNSIENFDFMAIHDNSLLSTLDFSKNKLKTISQNAINRALDVEVLNISSNNLNQLPITLNTLPRLKILDASFNHIKQFDGNSINNAQTLVEIKMPHNKIVELRTGSFKDLRELVTINLENNNIEIIHANAITNLPKLLSIYLNSNHIIDLPDHVFTNLPRLKIIDLQSNRLQFISPRAFENLPLVQYLNVSHNQLSNLDNSGLRQLSSLEVLDLSYNRLTNISRMSFQYMEWLVELNLDNNAICYIGGEPFNFMPRLKVLSLRRNKLGTVYETTFEKLRNNIAILDIDDNPLVCNCKLIWMKSWLQESSSLGPRCADGSYVKSLPFTRADCDGIILNDEDPKSCTLHENEALLPSLATSQVFTTIDKIRDYSPHLNSNKVASRPTPEESEYFYDEYVDYPYNETIGLNGLSVHENFTQTHVNKSHYTTIPKPTLNKNLNTTKDSASSSVPSSGFTFFGMPLPALDMGKLWNTGRKMDWNANKNSPINQQTLLENKPKFETGGFSPILPSTAGGFMPIPNSKVNSSQSLSISQATLQYPTNINISKMIVSMKPPVHTVQTNASHKTIKTEIHELSAFLGNDNNTHMTYNRTKNVQEQNSDPNKVSKYNFMESNLTITQVTEKDAILITTDTSNDMSLQGWLETSTAAYETPTTAKPPIKKHIENPTALSAILNPSEDISRRNINKRPATVTKVSLPHLDHYEPHDTNYSPVINREGKTRFADSTNAASTKPREANGREWYYKNYNKTNLHPFVAPSVPTTSKSTQITCHCKVFIVVLLLLWYY